jgi:hypothetical protein
VFLHYSGLSTTNPVLTFYLQNTAVTFLCRKWLLKRLLVVYIKTTGIIHLIYMYQQHGFSGYKETFWKLPVLVPFKEISAGIL